MYWEDEAVGRSSGLRKDPSLEVLRRTFHIVVKPESLPPAPISASGTAPRSQRDSNQTSLNLAPSVAGGWVRMRREWKLVSELLLALDAVKLPIGPLVAPQSIDVSSPSLGRYFRVLTSFRYLDMFERQPQGAISVRPLSPLRVSAAVVISSHLVQVILRLLLDCAEALAEGTNNRTTLTGVQQRELQENLQLCLARATAISIVRCLARFCC